jgi:hypothetical protein
MNILNKLTNEDEKEPTVRKDEDYPKWLFTLTDKVNICIKTLNIYNVIFSSYNFCF